MVLISDWVMTATVALATSGIIGTVLAATSEQRTLKQAFLLAICVSTGLTVGTILT